MLTCHHAGLLSCRHVVMPSGTMLVWCALSHRHYNMSSLCHAVQACCLDRQQGLAQGRFAQSQGTQSGHFAGVKTHGCEGTKRRWVGCLISLRPSQPSPSCMAGWCRSLFSPHQGCERKSRLLLRRKLRPVMQFSSRDRVAYSASVFVALARQITAPLQLPGCYGCVLFGTWMLGAVAGCRALLPDVCNLDAGVAVWCRCRCCCQMFIACWGLGAGAAAGCRCYMYVAVCPLQPACC